MLGWWAGAKNDGDQDAEGCCDGSGGGSCGECCRPLPPLLLLLLRCCGAAALLFKCLCRRWTSREIDRSPCQPVGDVTSGTACALSALTCANALTSLTSHPLLSPVSHASPHRTILEGKPKAVGQLTSGTPQYPAAGVICSDFAVRCHQQQQQQQHRPLLLLHQQHQQ